MFESNVTFKVKKQNLSPEHKMTLINDFANLSDYYKQYQQGLITKADFLYRASNLGDLSVLQNHITSVQRDIQLET